MLTQRNREPSRHHLTKIAITTGDEDGIGLEVTIKALQDLGPRRGVQFFICRSSRMKDTSLKQLEKKFQVKPIRNLTEGFELEFKSHKILLDVQSSLPPAHWFTEASSLALKNKISAVVTGPLSKKSMQECGSQFLGHTDYLRSLGPWPLFMAFWGKKLKIVLATDHLPLSEVSKRLTTETLFQAILAADQVRARLHSASAKKPMGLLGLNPHAGEEGLIGREEAKVFSEALTRAQRSGINVQGPLVPDAAFVGSSLHRYSVFIASYHDQGLIPFKMIHGYDSGVQVTLGLPFLRLSVDHGTAKEIYGQNKAQFGSMKDALLLAMNWTRSSDERRKR